MSVLDKSTASMSHIRHYQVLLWATGPLNLLESIAKVPDWQIAKTGKSSIFWLLSSFFHHDSTITAEAITTIQMQKNSINHWVLYSPLIALKKKELKLVSDSQVIPCLCWYKHFCLNIIFIAIASTAVQLNMCSCHAAVVYFYFRREVDSCRLRTTLFITYMPPARSSTEHVFTYSYTVKNEDGNCQGHVV